MRPEFLESGRWLLFIEEASKHHRITIDTLSRHRFSCRQGAFNQGVSGVCFSLISNTNNDRGKCGPPFFVSAGQR
jgi:hypothetical protein